MKNHKTKSEAARLKTSSTKSSRSSLEQKMHNGGKRKNDNVVLNSVVKAASPSQKSNQRKKGFIGFI